MTLKSMIFMYKLSTTCAEPSVPPGFRLPLPAIVVLGITLGVWPPSAVILFVIVSCVLCLLALHTNHHAYNLHEPKCISGAGDAIHAESVHHHFPP